jgi:LAO/AO transport system kinase
VTAAGPVAGVLAGEPRAIARAITLAEAGGPEGRALVAALAPRAGRAARVGLTGAPGAGKSTLAAALARRARADGLTVAVVAVDPTSPFTRGAVLGDRVRLVDLATDPGVFVRSMASRGHAGGLAAATADAVLVLDAAGFDVVLIETVGAGQGEVDVAALAETVVLALMPGGGDGVQAIKAGLMEIPDVLAVTKADRPGADALDAELRTALGLAPPGDWDPPVVRARALEEGGADEVWAAIGAHRAHLAEGDRMRRRRRDGLARRLRALAAERLRRRVEELPRARVAALADAVLDGALPPAEAVDALLAELHPPP